MIGKDENYVGCGDTVQEAVEEGPKRFGRGGRDAKSSSQSSAKGAHGEEVVRGKGRLKQARVWELVPKRR